MPNLQPLVDYLSINRRSREAAARETEITVEIVNQNYDSNNTFNNDTNTIDKTDLSDTGKYRKLSSLMTFTEQDFLYIEVVNNTVTPNILTYWEKRSIAGVIEYRVINDISWQVVNDSGFISVPLLHLASVYYYSVLTNRVIITSWLDIVTIFNDVFAYNPTDILPVTSGEYSLDYIDHKGLSNSVFNQVLKAALEGWIKTLFFNNDRKVEVSLSQAKGSVYLYPLIRRRENRYVLKYVYPDKTFSILGLDFLNSAIKLKFRYLGTMLEFLDQTIFSEGDFNSITGHKGIKQKFFDEYGALIKQELNFYSKKIEKVLELLYYTPKVFLKHLDTNMLWDIVGTALQQNLTNLIFKEEDIVLTLLQVLYENSKNSTIFLNELLIRQTNDNQSYFYKLFDKMNGDNFIKYNEFVKVIWLQSEFAKPKNKIYSEAKKEGSEALAYDGPIVYPYKSDNTLGIYHSNTNVDWVENFTKFKVVLETGEYKKTGKRNSRRALDIEEIKIPYYYHPLQPIFIINSDKQKTELKLDYKIPAFYLAATEVKKDVENIYTSIKYAVDVISTISGAGNLLKLRHVTKLTTLGKAITLARKGVAVIEITSGSTNALLKLTGVADTNLGNALSEYLFYLEMLSLSVDVTDWISKGLKKNATVILEKHGDDLNQYLDDLVKKGELDEAGKSDVFDELIKVSDISEDAVRKTKYYWNNYTFKNMLEGKKPCFLAGTLIHTTTGLKPIEQITVNDTVFCYNQIKKEIASQQVAKTYTNYTEKYAKFQTASGEFIEVTGQHLFYQKTSNTWIKAHQLKVGMHLYNAKTDSLEKIINKEVITKKVATYNFEVPEHHNYLVGNTGILAHNANKRPSYKDTTKRGYAFYELFVLENRQAQTLYIGKTTRENINIRAAEHNYEGELNKSKGIKQHTWWKHELNPSATNFNNSIPEHRFVQMTEFESAIWERYYIEKYQREIKELNPNARLRNRQMPLGKNTNSKTFSKYIAYWNKQDINFNPCKYF